MLKFGNMDPNVLDNNGNTVLHLIIKYYNKDETYSENMLKLFLKHGADPNILNQERWSALHLCVKLGRERALTTLLSVKTTTKIDPSVKGGEFGSSPIHLAVMANNVPMMIALAKAGADLLQRNDLGKLPRQYASTDVSTLKMVK